MPFNYLVFLDTKSVCLFTATVWLGMISIPPSGWATIIAAITTIAYNSYRFYQIYKNRNKKKSE